LKPEKTPPASPLGGRSAVLEPKKLRPAPPSARAYPVCEPWIGAQERTLVLECLETGWISAEGPFVAQFEDAFARFLGVEHGVAVSNGTAALETALYALGVGPGDEVIMPTFTIISCAAAALRLGAAPVLVDIEPDTWCMNVKAAIDAVTPRTKAIMAVHIYGHPVDMEPLMAAARERGIFVLEDAAEAHGALYRGRNAGSIGDAAAFSFYANKLVTTGEGGMLATSDAAIAARARSYRNLCFNARERFLHDDLGFNYRMTNMQAALGLGQLGRIEQTIEKKRDLGRWYFEELSEIAGAKLQIEKSWARSVYWMYAIELPPDLGVTGKALRAELGKRKIGTRPFFLGLHRQPCLMARRVGAGETFPQADQSFQYGLYLPSSLKLTRDDVAYIGAEARDAIRVCADRAARPVWPLRRD